MQGPHAQWLQPLQQTSRPPWQPHMPPESSFQHLGKQMKTAWGWRVAHTYSACSQEHC